jgi:hypothetical protein
MNAASLDRPKMRLLDWKPCVQGALLGRAAVLLPNGLVVSDIGIFSKNDRRWAQLPAEMMRDGDGQPLKDERGKARYRSAIKWSSRELQDGFSAALVALIEAEHGGLNGGGR